MRVHSVEKDYNYGIIMRRFSCLGEGHMGNIDKIASEDSLGDITLLARKIFPEDL